MAVTAIIPLKALASAKGRLAGALAPDERRTFVAWMARRVIAACHACPAIDRVLVVAGDEEAADVARDAGADVLIVEQPGLRIALERADEAVADALATLVVAADLPTVSPEDLQRVIDAAEQHAGAVVVAPTDDGGTGALLRRPPTIISTAYGAGSAAAHALLARAAGVHVAVVHRAGLATDVDTPGQLPAALALVAREDVGCRAR